MKVFNRTPRPRGGYTLTEMLMVQAVILVMVAASWPALRSPLGKSELLTAAREIRSELAKARLRAIQSGSIGELRFQPGTGHYELLIQPSPASSGTSDGRFRQRTSEVAHHAAQGSRTEESGDVKHGTLPADVRFCAPGTEWAATDEDALSDASVTSHTGEWSQPIYFFPNGRTSDAHIRLRGPRDTYVDVLLRGLTGSATIGEPHRDDEASRDAEAT